MKYIIFILTLLVAVTYCSAGEITIPPKIAKVTTKIKPNKHGGYDLYNKQGKMFAQVKKEWNGIHLYVMGRLKYKNIATKNNSTHTIIKTKSTYTKAPSAEKRGKAMTKKERVFYNDRVMYLSPTQRRIYEEQRARAAREAKRDAWRAKKTVEQEKNGTKIWDFWYRRNY